MTERRRRANFDIYEEKILEVLYKHPVSLSTSEVADKADIAWETAKDRLEDLWEDHYIEREDKGNSIEWWIEE